MARGGNMTRLAAPDCRNRPGGSGCGLWICSVVPPLEAVTQAAAKIERGLAELVLAGGLESSSTQPLRNVESEPSGL
ncbi:MAG: hypothetical protein ACLUD2_12455 [Clostridium sp.]